MKKSDEILFLPNQPVPGEHPPDLVCEKCGMPITWQMGRLYTQYVRTPTGHLCWDCNRPNQPLHSPA